MISPTYQIGDKVVVKENIDREKLHGWILSYPKTAVKGKICTVIKLIQDHDCIDGYCYVLKCDDNSACIRIKGHPMYFNDLQSPIFVKEWLDPYEEDQINIFENELINILGE